MGTMTGVKLLLSAMVFGGAAVIFTSVPFLLVIMRSIMKSRDNSTGGGNFLGTTILAFIIHSVSTICFMGTIYILDIVNKINEPNFFSGKVIKIFWAKTQSEAFSLAGISGVSSNEALGAWSTLLTVTTVTKLLYLCLPLVVILGAMAYGANLSTKDVYRQDHLTVIIYSGISMVCAMLLYIAWAMIATQGLFLPSEYSGGLLNFIGDLWRDALK